jgi:hypothetical protein
MILHSHVLDGPSGILPDISGSSEPRRLRVTVVFTTIEGTMAALDTATALARGLSAQIILVVTEVVYFRWSLESPPVSRHFFEELCLGLVHSASLDANKITFEIHFCRNQIQCLEQTLRPHSLVVLGAKRRLWFAPERKLEHRLLQLGHDVLLIDSASTAIELDANTLVSRLIHQTESCQRHP